jgi:CRP-like cAMP-binding protein
VAVAENRLIALLPRRSQLQLRAVSETVQLEPGAVLCTPGEPTRHVYFPLRSFISLVATVVDEPGLEVSMIGSEGMLGVQLVIGVDDMPLHAVVQGAGMARRVEAALFRGELARSPPLQHVLKRYLYVRMVQLATSAACTHFHLLAPRLARWLLLSHDRAHSRSFHATHELLASMLGVRRVGVTTAASDLQQRGYIRYHRGEVTVLNRAGLSAAACSCYAADRAAYTRLLS